MQFCLFAHGGMALGLPDNGQRLVDHNVELGGSQFGLVVLGRPGELSCDPGETVGMSVLRTERTKIRPEGQLKVV